jgi:hypothetical protein
MPDLSRIQERLKDHPECIEVEVMGEERPFLLTMYGIELANQRGYEIIPVIMDLGTRLANLLSGENDDVEIGSEEFTQKVRGLVRDEDARSLSLVVWWGLSTFDSDLTVEEVQMMLTPGTLLSLVPRVAESLNSFAEDKLPEEKGEGSDDPTKGSDSPEPTSSEPAYEQDTPPANTER